MQKTILLVALVIATSISIFGQATLSFGSRRKSFVEAALLSISSATP